MNSIILYFSYTGHSKKVAEKLARTQNAELVEIQPASERGKLWTYLVECPRAMMRKPIEIEPVDKDLSGYDLITLIAPVWAAYPAPAFNSMVKLLPKNKNVQVMLVSGSGSGATKKSEKGTRHLIHDHGCKLLNYKEVKQGA